MCRGLWTFRLQRKHLYRRPAEGTVKVQRISGKAKAIGRLHDYKACVLWLLSIFRNIFFGLHKIRYVRQVENFGNVLRLITQNVVFLFSFLFCCSLSVLSFDEWSFVYFLLLDLNFNHIPEQTWPPHIFRWSYDRLLASSCRPSFRPFVCLSVCL